MSSSLTTFGKNTSLNSLASLIKYLSVHDEDVPIDAKSEPVGGSPVYVRRPARWDQASNGIIALIGIYSFDIPPGYTVRSVGFWSSETGGVLYGYFDVVDEVYAGQGVHTLSSGSISL